MRVVLSCISILTTIVVLVIDARSVVYAFVHPIRQPADTLSRQRRLLQYVLPDGQEVPWPCKDLQSKHFQLTIEEAKPLLRFKKGQEQEKIVNAFGLWAAVVSLLTCPVWAAVMTVLNMVNQVKADFDPKKELYDRTGKIWSKLWLTLTQSFPTFSGDLTPLRPGFGPCLYVANHASWLDIPVLCTVLDTVFKFIAKGELRKVPCIGQQLEGGDHILIDREDRRSQLRTFKDGIAWLQKGVPIMAFPEGKRSRSGRLMEFKGGLFSMAAKTKVPIVPITISHAHAVMPGYSLLPVQSGAGKLHVHVHKPINADGRTEAELAELVRQAFLSTLPYEQHPFSSPESETSPNMPSEHLAQSIAHLHKVQVLEPRSTTVLVSNGHSQAQMTHHSANGDSSEYLPKHQIVRAHVALPQDGTHSHHDASHAHSSHCITHSDNHESHPETASTTAIATASTATEHAPTVDTHH